MGTKLMPGRTREYYEQSALWERDLYEDAHEAARITDVIAAIPPDTRSILDAGCGNGAFLNRLLDQPPGRFERLAGLDASMEALKHVRTERRPGSVSELPFDDSSFDLVTAMEVLEHLPQPDFQAAIKEIRRVSRRYILVTVPNAQNLAQALVMCPMCCCCFNPAFHVRSFDADGLRDLFAGCRPLRIAEIGPRSRRRLYGRTLRHALRLFSGSCPPRATAVCPQCGFQQGDDTTCTARSPGIARPVARALLTLNRLVTEFAPRRSVSTWLLALYEKTEPGA